jgi:hypothetical protein
VRRWAISWALSWALSGVTVARDHRDAGGEVAEAAAQLSRIDRHRRPSRFVVLFGLVLEI